MTKVWHCLGTPSKSPRCPNQGPGGENHQAEREELPLCSSLHPQGCHVGQTCRASISLWFHCIAPKGDMTWTIHLVSKCFLCGCSGSHTWRQLQGISCRVLATKWLIAVASYCYFMELICPGMQQLKTIRFGCFSWCSAYCIQKMHMGTGPKVLLGLFRFSGEYDELGWAPR